MIIIIIIIVIIIMIIVFIICIAPFLYIHTYIHKLYLSSDFNIAYIASISDPN